MLNKRPTTMRKKLKALTDPKPEFVSLVFAGANKTPFRAMKADQQGNEDMSHKQDTHAIASIEFDGNKFKSEAAVKGWLSEGGYTDATVAKTKSGWVAKGSGDAPSDAEIQTVDLKEDGVTMHVFEMNPGTPEDSAKSENSLRRKFDDCRAAVSSTYEEGRKKGDMKDVGPEMLNLTMALYDDLRVALRSGDKEAAKAVTEEFGEYVEALFDMFPGTDVPSFKAFVDAVAPEVDVTKETETAPEAESMEEQDAVKDEEQQETEADASEEEVEKEEEAEEADASEDEASEKEEEAEDAEKGMNERAKNKKPYMKDEGEGEDADEGETSEKEDDEDADDSETAEKESEDEASEEEAEKSDDPITALTAIVGNLAQSVESLKETMTVKSDKLAERVAAIEETRQTRKGADVDEANSGNTEQRKKSDSQEMEELRTRSVLGMRR